MRFTPTSTHRPGKMSFFPDHHGGFSPVHTYHNKVDTGGLTHIIDIDNIRCDACNRPGLPPKRSTNSSSWANSARRISRPTCQQMILALYTGHSSSPTFLKSHNDWPRFQSCIHLYRFFIHSQQPPKLTPPAAISAGPALFHQDGHGHLGICVKQIPGTRQVPPLAHSAVPALPIVQRRQICLGGI